MEKETKITYEQAKEAKKILLAWLGDLDYLAMEENRKEKLLWLALTQDYFLE